MSLYVWDMTLKWKKEIDINDIIKELSNVAKKWGFQEEIGEEKGYRHFQIRFSLIKKTSSNKLISMFKGTVLQGGNITPTSNGTIDSSGRPDIYYYVTKTATRVEGTIAYTDKDPPPPKMTKQLREFLDYDPYEWQLQARELGTNYDNRKITFIYDPVGKNGKSIFCEWMEFSRIADEIAMCNSFEDISAYVCSRRSQGFEPNCYLVDMPRGLKKEKLAQFYAGIECIKDGKCFDKRHSAKKIRFDRPQILIFTNRKPDEIDSLSKDRWQIKQLVQQRNDNNEIINRCLVDITHSLMGQYESTPNIYDTDTE